MRAKNKLVYGFGVNDADYAVKSGPANAQSCCPFYASWSGMIERCHSKKWLIKNPTYEGCSVCNEWLTFSKFRSWMEKQDWQGKHLDKDILFEGNKIYSPETCVFISPLTNTFANDYKNGRGKYLIGTDKHAQCNKFRSRCSNPFTGENEYLGLFLFERDAHMAWKRRKLQHAKLIAAMQTDKRVAEALIRKYS